MALNRTWEGPQRMEWQACRLQQEWLAGQGIEAGFNWFGIHLASTCPREIHP